MSFDIQEELKKIPDSPGVYIMHDKSDAIIYIGKAKSLTKRVHQYFQPSHDEGIKKKQMVEHIDHFEYIVTDSELEALVLENNLIKEHRPKYNTMLRDDKTYPYIKVTLGEHFPRVVFSRKVYKDKARYFGPFTSAGDVRETIELTNKLFHLRTCNRVFPRDFKRERPCLNYHIKQCPGICLGNISEEEYMKSVKSAMEFLEGKADPVIDALTEKMNEASKNLEFEKAATYRDEISAVKMCIQKQKITDTEGEDRDILAIALDKEDACAVVFFIRGGRMIGRDHFFLNLREDDRKEDLISTFIQQFYSGTPFVPKELFVQTELSEQKMLEDFLSEKKGSAVHIVTPKRGQKERLVELAWKNASLILTKDRERIKKEEGRTIGAMKELSGILGLPGIQRMEAYDISNTMGYQSVGSMVVFDHGKPLRNDYRKFRIKTVEGPNDYASMREVLTRRFTHGLEEKAGGESEETGSFTRFPDVIMMDGGRGQVNIALDVLKELGLTIPVCGMVKDDHHRTRGLFFNNKELPIDKSSEAFKLITRLQDEAHRFAIEYHRSLRGRNQVRSFLDDIPGIGPARRRALMKKYVSAEAIRNASVEDLAKTDTMNEKAAQQVWDYLHKTKP
ncbi:MAG: excinuclease ABC subunit UvrC [Lachnospiraceae bacterium]|uniref:UvrABC system protein C n=1 Tax=Candidatus Weimeria bifida TaxID=2599074 RepID=A0A6N7J015_9FIRM|nr:excinuclease ABC subunit UvrC [Candidatus Weimeria bifida]RRF96451.1 MAG: excinuclease ABC subunit UvrC [Lachnospiraceae bacterium]